MIIDSHLVWLVVTEAQLPGWPLQLQHNNLTVWTAAVALMSWARPCVTGFCATANAFKSCNS